MTSILFILIFSVAIIFSMLGLGGGILYVPLLLEVGLPFHQAATTSLTIMLIMSMTAATIYHLNKLVDLKIVFLLEPFSIIGAFLGSISSPFFSERLLKIIFAIIMLISSYFMIKTPHFHKPKKKNKIGFLYREKSGHSYCINLWAGIPLSLLAGFFSALLGVGGGFAKVPMMTLIFGMPTKIAVATSSAMIVITALTGVLGHTIVGHLNIKLTILLSFAVFLGANIGSRISIKANKKFLNTIFSIILIIVAVWLIYKSINL